MKTKIYKYPLTQAERAEIDEFLDNQYGSVSYWTIKWKRIIVEYEKAEATTGDPENPEDRKELEEGW
jgi:hypothetical protein